MEDECYIVGVPLELLCQLVKKPQLLATYLDIKIYLEGNTNRAGVCQDTLSWDLGVSMRTVKRNMKALREMGLISVSRQGSGKYGVIRLIAKEDPDSMVSEPDKKEDRNVPHLRICPR